MFTGFVAAYAFSPIDLIPDFIPVLGYLDDLVIVPLGVLLALKMIPAQVMAECRAKAEQALPRWGQAAVSLDGGADRGGMDHCPAGGGLLVVQAMEQVKGVGSALWSLSLGRG